MQRLLFYLKDYFSTAHKKLFVATTLFTGLLVFLNYYYGIDDRIIRHTFFKSFFLRYCISLSAFLTPYLFYFIIKGSSYSYNKLQLILILIAPAIFSLKMAVNVNFRFSENFEWNNYWNHIIYWPLLLAWIFAALFIIWKAHFKSQSFFGMTSKNFKWQPYSLLLLFMVPLIAIASTQHDFLEMYPKLKLIANRYSETEFHWWHKLLFEFSYGSDFIGIELFFRGFLVLAFVKSFGKDALLPMACFYCTIHFGKPLGECISSYFGGLVLGIIVYNTRSIWGGLVVHLGIAWLMEIGGYLGNSV